MIVACLSDIACRLSYCVDCMQSYTESILPIFACCEKLRLISDVAIVSDIIIGLYNWPTVRRKSGRFRKSHEIGSLLAYMTKLSNFTRLRNFRLIKF
jgi:hypothetical protein